MKLAEFDERVSQIVHTTGQYVEAVELTLLTNYAIEKPLSEDTCKGILHSIASGSSLENIFDFNYDQVRVMAAMPVLVEKWQRAKKAEADVKEFAVELLAQLGDSE